MTTAEQWSEHLRAEGARLAASARTAGYDARVPGCPGWTVADLVQHTATVYEHKLVVLETGERPREWRAEPEGQDLLEWYDDALQRLVSALGARAMTHTVWTWYPHKQDVEFWWRRMAQETLVHRIDADQAAGVEVSADAGLSSDGVDECLHCFVAFDDEHAPDDAVGGSGEQLVLRTTDTAAEWTVVVGPTGLTVSDTADPAPVAALSGPALDLLLWLWGRGGRESLTVDGDAALVDRVRELAARATE